MGDRQEFSKKIKLAAWNRAGGRCEDCGKKIRPGDGPEYDHSSPTFFGGAATLENCQVLCIACHSRKTSTKDIKDVAKSRRIVAKAAKAKDKRRGFRKPPAGYSYDWGSGRYVRD